MKRVEQSFTEGINERLPKDRDTGKRLLKLQNARLLGRGNTAFIERMQGFIRLWNDDWQLYTDPLGNIVIAGEHDTDTYNRGYRVRLSDSIAIEDETNMKFPAILTDRFGLTDNIVVKVGRTAPVVNDNIGLKDYFRYKRFKILRFKDTIGFAETSTIPINRYVYLFDQLDGITDGSTITQLGFFRMEFKDSIAVADQNTQKTIKTIRLYDSIQIADRDLECLDE